MPGHSTGPKGTYYFADVFPDYIIVGDEFIRPNESIIAKVVLYLDDATTLFQDFDAFGAVFFDAETIVQEIIQKEGHRGNRQTGPNARILYYTGRDEIVSIETSIGRVVVEHKPGFR